MRIAILCHSSAGGSGILATELAMGLSLEGHDVHVIGERPPFRMAGGAPEPIYRDLGDSPPTQSFWGQVVATVRKSFAIRPRLSKPAPRPGSLHFHELLAFEYPLFEQSSFPTLRAANTLATLIDKYKIEVVNAHYVIPHATSALLARDSGLDCRIITTLHGTDVTRVGRDPAFFFTTKHAINASDSVTAVCQYLADETRSTFGISRSISVIPNWVDCGRFKRNPDPKVRAQYAQPEEQILVHVSNFRPVKRSVEVVKIFAEIAAKIPARLILVGEGPEKKACIDLAISLGVFGRLLSIGPMANVEMIMGISDFLLLPSEMEGFPLVLLEGMAAGAICVASNVGGIAELVSNNENGLLFRPEDGSGMADSILGISGDKPRAEALRANALRTVATQYTPERLIGQYSAAYVALCRAGA